MSPSTLCIVTLVCLSSASFARADESPLHQRIDAIVDAQTVGPVAAIADDATFLRRLSLDLLGRVPKRSEVEAFLKDESSEKRVHVIDAMLSSDDFYRHLAITFDIMLMERRANKHVKTAEFRTYLENSFRAGKTYRQLAAEILAADGSAEKSRPAAAFYLEREVKPHVLTRDIGRVFYGVDLQCAQCHNHPNIDDYYQQDYYGLHAFLVRTSLFQPDKKKPALIAETASGEASFKSVFTEREGTIGPRVPQGTELAEATLMPGQEYQTPPAKNVRPVPVVSRIAKLSSAATQAPSAAFNRNIANRLWAQMFGRGLVHPVDLHHSGNPAVYPDVLELIADDFSKRDYIIPELLKEFALTKVYQRSMVLPDLAPSIADARQQVGAIETQIESLSKQASDADQIVENLIEKLDAAVAAAKPARDTESAALKGVVAATKPRDEAVKKVNVAKAIVIAEQAKLAAVKPALDTTTAAVAAVKEDKELAGALAIIQKRFDAISTSLNAAQGKQTAEQVKLDAANQALATKQAEADAAIAKRVPFEDAVRGLRTELFAARDRVKTLYAEKNTVSKRLEILKTLIAYDDSQLRIQTLVAAINTATATVADLDVKLPVAQSAVDATTAARDQMQVNVTSQQENVTRAKVALAQVQQTHAKIAASIKNAEEASGSVAEDENLASAIALLKKSLLIANDQVEISKENVTQEEAAMVVAQTGLTEAEKQRAAAVQALTGMQQNRTTTVAIISKSKQDLDAVRVSSSAIWEQLIDQSASRFNAAGLSALSPEQLGLSLLIASGQYGRQRASVMAKLDKEKPLTDEMKADAAVVSAREKEIETATRKAVEPLIAKFVSLYGAAAGQPQTDFFATAEQSLFMANGNEVRSWLSPAAGNLTDRLRQLDDPAKLAQELYLSVLSRMPTADEVNDVVQYLDGRAEKKQDAVQELAWALITSAEFRFRH